MFNSSFHSLLGLDSVVQCIVMFGILIISDVVAQLHPPTHVGSHVRTSMG